MKKRKKAIIASLSAVVLLSMGSMNVSAKSWEDGDYNLTNNVYKNVTSYYKNNKVNVTNANVKAKVTGSSTMVSAYMDLSCREDLTVTVEGQYLVGLVPKYVSNTTKGNLSGLGCATMRPSTGHNLINVKGKFTINGYRTESSATACTKK